MLSQAKAVRASVLVVTVEVKIDEKGDVFFVKAASGHPLLKTAAEEAAARKAKFIPMVLEDAPANVSGVFTYNFIFGEDGKSPADSNDDMK